MGSLNIHQFHPPMTLSPTIIYECPSCKRLVGRPSLASGNSIEAKRYSDGKVAAPFFPSFADLIRCRGCSGFFRLSTLKPLGSYKAPRVRLGGTSRHREKLRRLGHEVPSELFETTWDPGLITIFNDDDPEYLEVNHGDSHPWMDTDTAVPLSILEYQEVFQRYTFVDQADEEDTRTELWWLFNDRARNGEPLFESPKDETLWKENLEHLLSILDLFYVRKKFKAAEIHRSLGNFDPTLEILSSIKYPSQQKMVEFYAAACRNKDSSLLVIESDSSA